MYLSMCVSSSALMSQMQRANGVSAAGADGEAHDGSNAH